MKKEEFIAELDKAHEVLKDFNKLKHLFSEDEGERTLAELRSTTSKIRMFLEMQEMKEVAHPKNEVLKTPLFGTQGSLVSVRPVGEEYNGKTYLGFLIGEIALGSSLTISEEKIQCNWAQHNPAIFVPELGEVIYGCESWWGEIESEQDFRKITDSDIDNIWYVKLWKKMNEKKEAE